MPLTKLQGLFLSCASVTNYFPILNLRDCHIMMLDTPHLSTIPLSWWSNRFEYTL